MKKYHFDLIIANPPYGSIGTNITEQIIKNIDYNEYVNLMPATNYRLSKTDLQQYVDPADLVIIYNAFDDAAVLPTIGRINKERVNSLTSMEFRIEMQTDLTTKKYFKNNLVRPKVWSDIQDTAKFANELDQSFSKIIFLPMRLSSGVHSGLASLSRGTKGLPYRIALDLIKDQSEVGKENPQCGTYVRFNTEQEKQNCGSFLFGSGFKFVLYLLNSMRVDVANKAEHMFWFPKVDWSRPWTPEEILVEYGYTDEEIKQVMTKLEEFPNLKILD